MTFRRSLELAACILGLAACSSTSTNENGSGGAAGAGGATAGIQCGGPACSAVDEKCCFSKTDVAINGTECTSKSNVCNPGTHTLQCNDQSDCEAAGNPGTVCCATLAGACDNFKESCIDSAQCVLPANCGSSSVILCDPAAKDACPLLPCTQFSGQMVTGYCGPK